MKFNKKKAIIIFAATLLLLVFLFLWLSRQPKTVTPDFSNRRIKVSTSLFFIYDFAKNIGGERAEVSLILPPGQEYHYFRPSKEGLEQVASSDLFFFLSTSLEPWAQSVTGPKVENLGDSLMIDNDPYVWLDFERAAMIIDHISDSYQKIDPGHRDYYQANASIYKKYLQAMDDKYKSTLATCKYQDVIEGGYSNMGYLAKKYNLYYLAALDFFPDSPVVSKNLELIITRLQESGQKYTFYPELIMPSWGEFIRQSSKAIMLPFNSASNILRVDELKTENYLDIMTSNLESLKIGLECE